MSEDILDIVIVGGGIAGVGCASMLPDTLSLALLESESQCGYHSTGRSAAAWIAGYGGPEIRVLTGNSKSYLSHPPVEISEQGFLEERGEMIIARTAEEQVLLKELMAEIQDLERVSIHDACNHVPLLRSEGLLQAAYSREAYDIDADRLHQAWLRNIKRRGAQILTGYVVEELSRVDGYWKVSGRNQPTLRARTVVNAAGAWADSLAALAGLSPLGLIPHRRSAALVPAPEGFTANQWPLLVSAQESWYARPMGGKLMVSPADETPVEPHDAYAEELTIAEGLSRFEEAVDMSVVRVETTWAGLRTFAPDRIPVLGFDPRSEGFFWLAGQGGYGIQTAPEMSRLAAACVASDAVTESDEALLERLSPARLIAQQ
ncbi:MAG: NAD(P)/FAD-dependent oxidoreductase [Granulosicoccus sp.]